MLDSWKVLGQVATRSTLPLPTLHVPGCMILLLMNAWLSTLLDTWRCIRLTMKHSNKKQAIYSHIQIAFERGMHTALIRAAIAFSPFLRDRGWDKLAEIHLTRAQQPAQSRDDNCSLFGYYKDGGTECM